eukprot:365906-Chlamydomonas_euryale.AAC.16
MVSSLKPKGCDEGSASLECMGAHAWHQRPQLCMLAERSLAEPEGLIVQLCGRSCMQRSGRPYL